MANITKQYWKGLEEYHGEAEFEEQKHHEFAEHLPIDDVLSENDLNLKSNRRDFLKFMGFSISAATLAACSRSPVKKAIPFSDKPVENDPGVADYYATTSFATEEALPVLAKTREGRPIKIEPNSQYTLTNGGTSAADQASVLSLYDNNRLRGPLKGTSEISWEDADKEITEKLEEISQNGGQIRLLTDTVISPSVQSVIRNFSRKYNNVKHITYDAASSSALIEANRQSFEQPYIPDYRFEEAKTIVGFNADFLGTWIAPVEFTKKYTQGRNVDNLNDMSFHVQFESTLSLTGSNADLRAPMKPSQEGAALVALYNHLAQKAGVQKLDDPGIELAGNAIKMAAKELWKHRGKTLVVSGTNDLDIQLLTNKINALLENYGNTIRFDHASRQRQGNDQEVDQLIKDMENGNVGALIVYGANPVYSHPKREAFEKGLEKVDLTVSLNERHDETAQQLTYKCPNHHFLEAWNDAQPKLGYFTLGQPAISPVFKTRAGGESLLKWCGVEESMHDYIKRFWEENLFPKQDKYANFWEFWNNSVHDGYFQPGKGVESYPVASADTMSADTAFQASVAASFVENKDGNSGKQYNQFDKNLDQAAKRLIASNKEASGYEVVLYQKVGLRDGRQANNPWLQEMPDPISKVTWDNYACMSPKMAEEEGLNDEDVIRVQANGKTLRLPVHKQPGQPYGTIGIAVGYGRFWGKDNGPVADKVGQNAYALANVNNGYVSFAANDAKFEATGTTYPLAATQTHHHIEGRDLIREAPLQTYLNDPKSVEHDSHHLISLYKDYNYNKGHHWAMAIDLNACTGCGACVISCQAENNVPVVGKQEVRRRREMHWIRIDRYYGGDDPENPTVNFQPLMCQQCDNAPCENVCPVAAISHSSEGINQQVYNRCVGTRYCANNCPYKVRRFNWFKYAENDNFDYNMNSDLGRMVLNPDVTVRSRGVMEKCTFCIQKIQSAKLDAKKEDRALKDGEAKTACQTACPANAIVFGDINDPESEIHKLIHKNHRAYGILTEVGTKPTVNYMSKIRNRSSEEEA